MGGRSDSARPPTSRSVLLVEDEALIRMGTAALLEAAGWRVTAVRTVAEALEALPERPGVILLDLMLPDGSGTAVLRRARELDPACRVIVCTGVCDRDPLAGMAEKPTAIIRKPYLPDDLLELLEGD